MADSPLSSMGFKQACEKCLQPSLTLVTEISPIGFISVCEDCYGHFNLAKEIINSVPPNTPKEKSKAVLNPHLLRLEKLAPFDQEGLKKILENHLAEYCTRTREVLNGYPDEVQIVALKDIKNMMITYCDSMVDHIGWGKSDD